MFNRLFSYRAATQKENEQKTATVAATTAAANVNRRKGTNQISRFT